MTISLRPPRCPSIVRGLVTQLLRPPLAVYGWLRSLVSRSGVLDYCETAGFTVRESAEHPGGFAVTSAAEPGFKSSELVDLAMSLREAGYLVELAAGGDEPCVLVDAPHVESDEPTLSTNVPHV